MSGSAWKKPEDVMRLMREKKRALQNRFRNAGPSLSSDNWNSNSDSTHRDPSLTSNTPKNSTAVKRKNPFRYDSLMSHLYNSSYIALPTGVLLPKNLKFKNVPHQNLTKPH